MRNFDICIIAVAGDASVANKLADSIRKYRLPSGVVLPDSGLDYRRVYVDVSGRELDDDTRDVLDNSRFLAVLCSPETKASPFILERLEYFRKIGVRVKVIDIPTTMMEIEGSQNAEWILDMINNILIEVLASIAENARLTIRQRQREGIDAKRESGKWDDYGRPNIEKPSNWDSVIAEWKAGQITAVKAMEKLNMKKTSFYKLVKMETAN